MNEVIAWQADDGSLHATQEDAAVASLLHLAATAAHNTRGAPLSAAQARFIVENRKKIRDLLFDIDNHAQSEGGWLPPRARKPRESCT